MSPNSKFQLVTASPPPLWEVGLSEKLRNIPEWGGGHQLILLLPIVPVFYEIQKFLKFRNPTPLTFQSSEFVIQTLT